MKRTCVIFAFAIGSTACASLGGPQVSQGTVDTIETGSMDSGDSGATGQPDTAQTPDTGEPLPPPMYGFWGLNGYVSPVGFADVQERFGITGFQVASAVPNWAVHTLLPMVRDAGLRVTLRLTHDHTTYTVDGDFHLESWKQQLPEWKGSGVEEFIEDGTLVGHMLLDDITNFPGSDPSAADLEEMARYSKELLPGLMTFVRQQATDMPVPEAGQYVYVDAAVNQYVASEGDVEAYAEEQEARAAELDLGVINGLNIADGGDGSAGRPGFSPHRYPMTAEEITEYGTVLANVPSCGMFLNWEYDAEQPWSDGTIGADYFDQPELQAALADLAEVVAAHPPVTLLKESDGH